MANLLVVYKNIPITHLLLGDQFSFLSPESCVVFSCQSMCGGSLGNRVMVRDNNHVIHEVNFRSVYIVGYAVGFQAYFTCAFLRRASNYAMYF